jgi:predicted 3-demethylubiquinone-9 3-methyltransferase (glyoxalase superfamily)
MTAPVISTCLWFEKDAEEAASLYCSLFPDAVITNIFRQQGDPQNRAFLVEFTLMGQSFMAMNGGPHYKLSPASSVFALVEGQQDVDRLWAALLEGGGQESRCGWLVDRFGLSWQIIPRALTRLMKSDRSGRVAQAMMAMVKIDVAALEAAAKG